MKQEDHRLTLVNRVNLIHSWNVLVDTLGRLAAGGSEQAAFIWDLLPTAAPVGSPTTLRRALVVALGVACPLDAAVEWNSYLTCLAAFKAAPLFGPAPMPVPEGCLAALDNGNVWLFERRR